MADASDAAGRWLGQSGRRYEGVPTIPRRQGSRRSVLAVTGQGEGVGGPEGRRFALVRPLQTSEAALAGFQQELAALAALGAAASACPGPRLVEPLSSGPGALLEWCDVDLERWWITSLREPEGFRNLCLALADACRRAADWLALARGNPAIEAAPPRIRPRGILRAPGGRWVLSGFGRAALAPIEEEEGAATALQVTSSGFVAPELLFGARVEQLGATLTWSLGASLFSLLEVRALLQAGGHRAAELPAGGTDSPHLRSHRASLIEDLLQRKPGLFQDRPLEPRQFLYPDRLPDRDRRTVTEAMRGLFGEPQEVLETQLAKEILRILDSALSIEPGRRYLDPMLMAGDLEGLARRFRVMRSTIAAARFSGAPGEGEATALLGDDPTEEEASPAEEPTGEALPSPAGSPPSEEDDEEPATVQDRPLPVLPSSPRPAPSPRAHSAPVARALPSPPPPSPSPPPPPRAGMPAWVRPTLVVLVTGQVLCIALVAVLLARRAPQPEPPAGAAAPSTLLQDIVEEVPAPPLAPPVAAPVVPADTASPEPPEASPPPVEAPPAVEPSPPPPPPTRPPVEATQAPVVPSSTPSAPTPPAPTPPAPRAERTAAPAGSGTTGTVRVTGASVRLQGAGGTRSPGTVPAGTWSIQMELDGTWTEVGTVTVTAGQEALVRCGFGRCRQEQ